MHNHLSGDPKPGREDIEMTREIKAAAEALGITIDDHLVIGRDRSPASAMIRSVIADPTKKSARSALPRKRQQVGGSNALVDPLVSWRGCVSHDFH